MTTPHTRSDEDALDSALDAITTGVTADHWGTAVQRQLASLDLCFELPATRAPRAHAFVTSPPIARRVLPTPGRDNNGWAMWTAAAIIVMLGFAGGALLTLHERGEPRRPDRRAVAAVDAPLATPTPWSGSIEIVRVACDQPRMTVEETEALIASLDLPSSDAEANQRQAAAAYTTIRDLNHRVENGHLVITTAAPIDLEEAQAVAGSFSETFSCSNDGNVAGFVALLSSNFLALLSEEGIRSISAEPESGETPFPQITLTGFSRLWDGRVLVQWLVDPTGAQRGPGANSKPLPANSVSPKGSYFIFAMEDGEWKLDMQLLASWLTLYADPVQELASAPIAVEPQNCWLSPWTRSRFNTTAAVLGLSDPSYVPIDERTHIQWIRGFLRPATVDGRFVFLGGSPVYPYDPAEVATPLAAAIACAQQGRFAEANGVLTVDAILRASDPDQWLEGGNGLLFGADGVPDRARLEQPRLLPDDRIAVIVIEEPARKVAAGPHDQSGSMIAPPGDIYVFANVDGVWQLDLVIDATEFQVSNESSDSTPIS